MANYDLGSAHGKVVIDYDNKGIQQSKDDLDQVKQKGLSAGDALDKTGRTMGRAGLVVAAGIGLAVKSAADFEQSISNIGAVTGATGAQLDQVRTKALQLGKDTQFSAGEAASAIGELAKAGISLPDIMNGAADATVALAAAGGVALPEAATLASNAMNQFSLKAQDMPKIADLIAGAANASAIDVHDFGESISQAGAVAHSVGLSFKDTATAIAIMGNAGIKGSDAGTSLKQMLLQLANPTDQAKKLMQQLGFNAFTATGQLKPLDQIAQGLKDSMQNMTPEARNAALAIIFGSDAARAGAVFFQNGAAGVDKMAEAMGKVKAADVAKTKMDNLHGSVEQLKGSVETAAIQFGELGQGPMKSVIDAVTNLINWFSGLSSNTQQTIAVMVASLGGLALFGAGLIKTVKYVQELTAVLKALRVIAGIKATFTAISAGVELLNGSLLTLAANPVVLIIAAIVVAVALLTIGIIELWKHSETFRNIVTGVWNGIKAVIGAVVDFAIGAFKVFMKGVDGLMVVVRAVGKGWNAVWSVLAPVVRVVFGIITSVIKGAMLVIQGAIAVGMALIRTQWAIWNFFLPILQAVWNLIVAVVKLAIAALTLVITLALAIIKQTWLTFWAGLKLVVQTAWDGIMAVVNTAVTIITAVFHAAAAVWRAVFGAVMAAIHAIVNSWIGQKVVGVVRTAVGWIKSAFNGLASLAKTIGRFFEGIYNAAKGPIEKFLKTVAGIGGKVLSAFKSAGSWLLNAGKNIIIGLINGITSKINSLRSYLNNITGWIKKWKGPPSKDKVLLTPQGSMILDGFMKGIRSEIPKLEKLLSSIGPGNIATSVAKSETVNAAVSATLASATGNVVAPGRGTAPGTGTTALIDHDALVSALREAGVGDVSLSLDGEVVSRSVDKNSGRRANMRRRVQ